MKQTSMLASAVMLGIPLCCDAQSAPQTYTLTDLGTVSYDGGVEWISGVSINSAGDITGNVGSSMGGAPNYAFLYKDGSITNLGTLGGQLSDGRSISDVGQVVGSSFTWAGVIHAFLYQDNLMQDLGTLGGASSSGNGISRCNGLIVGAADTSAGNSHAFLYSDGVMHDLGTLGGARSGAQAVNASGQIVGFADTGATVDTGSGPLTVSHAFLYSAGVMQDLGTLPTGSTSMAQAINAAGHVAGESSIGGLLRTHAFLYRDGVMQDIGTLPGTTNTQVTGMDSADDVVGYAGPMDSLGRAHGFLYSNGTMMDLNGLLDPSDPLTPNVVIESGQSITETGVILAEGHDLIGAYHTYLLKPSVPRSTTTADAGTCSAGNNPPPGGDASGTSSSSGSDSSSNPTPFPGGNSNSASPITIDQASSAGSSTSTGGGGAIDTFTLLLLLGSLGVQALRSGTIRAQAD